MNYKTSTRKKKKWVMSMQCIHGYTVYEKRMYVCLYWLWSTDYVQMCEILWNKYSFMQAKPEPMLTHHHCESSCNSTEDNSTCSRYHYQKSIRNLHIENYLKGHSVKSLWPHEAIWWHRSGSKLARLTACCMMPPSLCLNQCWLTISMVWWHSLEGIIIRIYEDSNQ